MTEHEKQLRELCERALRRMKNDHLHMKMPDSRHFTTGAFRDACVEKLRVDPDELVHMMLCGRDWVKDASLNRWKLMHPPAGSNIICSKCGPGETVMPLDDVLVCKRCGAQLWPEDEHASEQIQTRCLASVAASVDPASAAGVAALADISEHEAGKALRKLHMNGMLVYNGGSDTYRLKNADEREGKPPAPPVKHASATQSGHDINGRVDYELDCPHCGARRSTHKPSGTDACGACGGIITWTEGELLPY